MLQQKITQRRYSQHVRQSEDMKFFKIICKNCNLALRSEIRQKKQQNDQIRIMGAVQDAKSIKQLWMFKSLRDRKEIVNFWTDLVIDSDSGNVKLQRGKQKASQKFQIQYLNQQRMMKQTKTKRTLARIKDSNNFYLTLDGTLQVAKYDQNDEAQVYQIRQVNPRDFVQLKDSFQITEPESKQSLDVARGQLTISAEVCVFQRNLRANQRWLFDPELTENSKPEATYSIINLLSRLRLWHGKKNNLIQYDNRDKVWQIQDKIGTNGSIYNTQRQKYLSRLPDGRLMLTSQKMTHWSIIPGSTVQFW